MIATALSTGTLAFAALAAAGDMTAFSLVCTGEVRTHAEFGMRQQMPVDRREPWTGRFRLDAAAGQWCAEPCRTVQPFSSRGPRDRALLKFGAKLEDLYLFERRINGAEGGEPTYATARFRPSDNSFQASYDTGSRLSQNGFSTWRLEATCRRRPGAKLPG